ncbi:hypothetical protein [Deinococcus sp.]|uniref:hypothetical protein n=1 Tax=Deinococcus sp. TaxID=47478 RepID=UPI003CC50807
MSGSRLLNHLKRFRDVREASSYLDFVGDLLTELALRSDDLRFHFNPTGSGNSILPLTINNRYVIVKERDRGGVATW